MSSLSQRKILNVRLSPEIYELFEKKVAKIGLRPSSFLRHFIISVALENWQKNLEQFILSLPSTKIEEKTVFKMVENERKKLYKK
ncbi:hypothetical protein HYW87_04420 [Candidatus Roizmanbacteria bacterium]|nr:hypothetical protein [Candidatus Roizmanbacteria bacterium]